MHAGAAHFDHARCDVVQPRQIELALRVQPSQFARPMRRQDAVGADDAQRVEVADDQVIAVGIEVVGVDAGVRVSDLCPHFLCEDFIAQALGVLEVGRRMGQCNAQARFAGTRVWGLPRPRGCPIVPWMFE